MQPLGVDRCRNKLFVVVFVEVPPCPPAPIAVQPGLHSDPRPGSEIRTRLAHPIHFLDREAIRQEQFAKVARCCSLPLDFSGRCVSLTPDLHCDTGVSCCAGGGAKRSAELDSLSEAVVNAGLP